MQAVRRICFTAMRLPVLLFSLLRQQRKKKQKRKCPPLALSKEASYLFFSTCRWLYKGQLVYFCLYFGTICIGLSTFLNPMLHW